MAELQECHELSPEKAWFLLTRNPTVKSTNLAVKFANLANKLANLTVKFANLTVRSYPPSVSRPE